MQRIKRVFVLIHVIFWILLTLLACLQLSQETSFWRTLTRAFIATSLFAFYGNFWLLTRYPGKEKRSAYFSWLAAILLTAPLLYMLLHFRRFDTADIFREYYFISMISIVFPLLFLGWLARVTENLLINTVKKEQLEKGAVEAELYYLKSQINPHFLFNTLNNIHALVYKQAPAAPEAVLHLASLMRYMIYESNAPTVSLSREVNYLQDYISLQQLRYKDEPVVDLEIAGDTEACHVAPLLFIHLLENAYKHAPPRLHPGDLKVRVEVTEDMLTFSLQNPVGTRRSATLDEWGGIGLPNVRKRLALLYPGQHTLEVSDDGEMFAVVLKIESLQMKPYERKAHLLYH